MNVDEQKIDTVHINVIAALSNQAKKSRDEADQLRFKLAELMEKDFNQRLMIQMLEYKLEVLLLRKNCQVDKSIQVSTVDLFTQDLLGLGTKGFP